MSERSAQVIILVEDKQQRTFVTRFLQGLGYPPHKLKSLPLPAGKGSGEHYVREHYAEEVLELRRRVHHLALALVVVIDADDGTVEDRQRQLADELRTKQAPARGSDERIIHLIPRRNIETWIAYLGGQPVNEDDNYPRLRGHERDCQRAVDRLIQLCQTNQPLPQDCPPSLSGAIAELKRLR